jgi:hypothetical protein
MVLPQWRYSPSRALASRKGPYTNLRVVLSVSENWFYATREEYKYGVLQKSLLRSAKRIEQTV